MTPSVSPYLSSVVERCVSTAPIGKRFVVANQHFIDGGAPRALRRQGALTASASVARGDLAPILPEHIADRRDPQEGSMRNHKGLGYRAFDSLIRSKESSLLATVRHALASERSCVGTRRSQASA
ncbi:MAG: hypothetical protein ACP5O0_02980 [Acidimicrobiales bacterium]